MIRKFRSTITVLVSLLALCGALATQAADELSKSDASTQTTSKPLEGHLTRHSLGVRSLPADGREPDGVIGHFAVGVAFMTKLVSKPPSRFVTMVPKIVKKWQGKQVFPCVIKLEKLNDGSDGYYFKTFNDSEGPCGWMMPLPKVPGKDKVTPWAIYFDQ